MLAVSELRSKVKRPILLAKVTGRRQFFNLLTNYSYKDNELFKKPRNYVPHTKKIRNVSLLKLGNLFEKKTIGWKRQNRINYLDFHWPNTVKSLLSPCGAYLISVISVISDTKGGA